MGGSVYKIIEVVGTSPQSWEDAAKTAVETAAKSLEDLRVAEVVKQDVTVEDGKVTAPVKGATLIGNGPDALTRVSMIGNDMKLDDGVGTCGKEGQGVPVGVGQPTMRIDGLTVGGTAV